MADEEDRQSNEKGRFVITSEPSGESFTGFPDYNKLSVPLLPQ